MAFWIGQLIGSFIAAILVPLFLFHFASRDGRRPRSALALRIAAVLVAVLATAVSAVGSGGQFPAGAILAVVVCFVWAIRATLRDRGERLNGWQRLGVLASVIWLPVGFFAGNWWWIQSTGGFWVDQYQHCLQTSIGTQTDLEQCSKGFEANYSAAITGHWWGGFGLAVVVLAVAWGLAWLIVRLFRWVRAGFTQQET
jgi:hypothetical protein